MPLTTTIVQFSGGVSFERVPGINSVQYVTSKEFIKNFDLKPCGCLETTDENLAKLQSCAPSVYGCYYASCGSCDVDYGGYKVFEETGLLQLKWGFPLDRVYVEYEGSLPKVNGQLQVPEVSFEATVEGVKLRSIKNRKNEPYWRIQMYDQSAKEARRKMVRILGRFSLSYLIDAAMRTPKFDIKRERWYECFSSNAAVAATSSSVAADDTTSSSGGTTVIEVVRPDVTFEKRQFTVGESGSPMVEGQTTWIIQTPQGKIEKNVFENSVNVILDNASLQEEQSASISPTVTYTPEQTTVEFNQGVLNGQAYTISYAKATIAPSPVVTDPDGLTSEERQYLRNLMQINNP